MLFTLARQTLLLCLLGVCGKAAADESKLRVEIVAPQIYGHRELHIGKGEHVFVVLTNDGDAPVRLWQEGYSWGYYALSFELVGEPTAQRITKLPRGWNKNIPGYFDVPPHEPFVIDVQLDSAVWSLPRSLTMAAKDQIVLRIRAVYKVAPDTESRRLHAWTGEIHSPIYEVVRVP